MCAGPPATLDCKKRSNSRLAESRRRVDGFPATVFVHWTNRCSMTYSSLHGRTVSLSLEPYVLGAAHYWQKWDASSVSPGHLNIELRRGCLIHVSVILAGYWLPVSRGPGKTAWLLRLVEWNVSVGVGSVGPGLCGTCGRGGEARRENGAVPPDRRKR